MLKTQSTLRLWSSLVLLIWGVAALSARDLNLDWTREAKALQGIQSLDHNTTPLPIPTDEELVAQGALIGTIHIRNLNVFDPSKANESRALFRLANRIHVTTRSGVVEKKLLFHSGDLYSPRVLRETERYFRTLRFIHDAWIQPIAWDGTHVDLLVVTRDVWTLAPGASFNREGGDNTWSVHVQESNLFGTGRFLDVKYTDDRDRTSYLLGFVDNNTLGAHNQIRLWIAENSDGYRRFLEVQRPFISLDDNWSADLKVFDDLRFERRFRSGRRTHAFEHQTRHLSLGGALSKGQSESHTSRWGAGFTWDQHLYDRDPRHPTSKPIPEERTSAYPWISYHYLEDGYIQFQNLDQLSRAEDYNLGAEFKTSLGYSSPTWGGTREEFLLSLDFRRGWSFKDRHRLFLQFSGSGRVGTGGEFENGLVSHEIRYYRQNFKRHQFFAGVAWVAAWDLDPERQLLLGGEDGLRGYDSRYTDGDRRVVVNVEQRFYLPKEYFSLVHLGGAVFFDVGRAWYAHHPELESEWIKDVGLGLRLSSSRSSEGKMLHLDVAFPLDGSDREIQWLVSTHQSF